VQQRDRIAEAAAEAADGLRRQGDLRDEDDHALPALQRLRGNLEVDLGLAGPGDPVEQEALAGSERRRDFVGGRALRRVQADPLVDRPGDLSVGPASALDLAGGDQAALLQAAKSRPVGAGLVGERAGELRPGGQGSQDGLLAQAEALLAHQRRVAIVGRLDLELGQRPHPPGVRPAARPGREHQPEAARRRRGVFVPEPAAQLHKLGRHSCLQCLERFRQLRLRNVAGLGHVDHHALDAPPPEGDDEDRAHPDVRH
jgi:hypothetical protein